MLVEIEDLRKVYRGGAVANDGIDLRFDAGEVVGIFGPNGAGKTTLVRQLVGLLRPTSGAIRICGRDVARDPRAAKEMCAYQPQSPVGIAGLTPRLAVELMGRMRGGRRGDVQERATELFDTLDLGSWVDKPLVDLSGGIARLVLFCAATVTPAPVVILDEPTNDVDPLRRRRLWSLVRRLADDGSAVLLVTHSVIEAERAVDRLAIITNGRVVASGTPASVKGDGTTLHISVTIDGVEPVEPHPLLQAVSHDGRRISGWVEEADLVTVIAWAQDLRRSGIAEEFSVSPATLEDAYERFVPATCGATS